MASSAKPTGCYKCGKSDHWSRDCPSQPASETPTVGASASAAATPSSSGFSKAAGTQGGTQFGSQGGFQRWQGNNQGYKRKEPWNGRSSGSFVAKEKPVKVPAPPRRMPKLTPDLLLGADGLGYVLEKIPRQVTIKGRGHEVEDLKSLLEAYLRWHQTLLPYYSYSQFVEKVEKVGSSKRVRLCVRELRQKIEKGEKFSSVDMNAVDENDGHAEAPVMRYETDSDEEENHADPPVDVLEEHLREATSVQVPEAAFAPTTRPVLVLGQESITVIQQDIKDEQRARMEANKQKALERARARKLELEKDESEIRPHKVSCQIDKKDATEVIDTLSKRLKDRGLNVKIIFSHGIDLDVLPKGAGKGEALAFLLHKMKTEGWAPQETLVCGDSGNDIELFEVEGVNGVIVGGVMEELRQWYEENGKHKNKVYQAKARCAGGIVEALEKLSLGPHLSPRDRMNSTGIQASENALPARSGCAQREIVEFNTFFEKWMNGEVPSDSETFQRLTSVIASGSTMVYPWGVEKGLLESVSTAQSKHGVTKDNKFRTWIDCIQEQKLGDGVYMVTWHSWQMSEGSERQGYFATAILREKEGTPNGVEWLRVHETSRKS